MEEKPSLKIVRAEELDTDPDKRQPRQRSALVQSFLDMADQLEKEIERIQKL
jgi:hypothetical protein